MAKVKCRRGEVTGLTCYIAGCREPACCRAHNLYAARYRNNDLRMRPASEAEELLSALRERMTLRQVSRVTGISVQSLGAIGCGRRKSVHRSTVRLLEMADEGRATPYFVDATGMRRRLQALAVLGWSPRSLAAECGMGRRVLKEVREGLVTVVRPVTAAKIRTAYERLWDQRVEGRAGRQARAYAAKCGYAPPLAWDDIDDPDEQPQHLVEAADDLVDEVAVMERKPSTRAEVEAVIEDMLRRGFSDNRVSLELGRNAHVVARVRRRMEAEAEEAAA